MSSTVASLLYIALPHPNFAVTNAKLPPLPQSAACPRLRTIGYPSPNYYSVRPYPFFSNPVTLSKIPVGSSECQESLIRFHPWIPRPPQLIIYATPPAGLTVHSTNPPANDFTFYPKLSHKGSSPLCKMCSYVCIYLRARNLGSAQRAWPRGCAAGRNLAGHQQFATPSPH